MLRPCFKLATLLIVCCLPVGAQTSAAVVDSSAAPAQAPTNDPCASAKQNKSVNNIVGCAQKLYDKFLAGDGVHAVLGGVAPGGGLGGGIGYTHRNNFGATGRWRMEFNSSAIITFNKYWEVDTNLRLSKGHTKGNLYAQVRDMRRLDFFGLGPESNLSGQTKYHYREGALGADIAGPVAPWLDLGSALENIFPQVIRITDPNVRSIDKVYTEATAPGLAAQTDFFHYVAFAQLHTPGQPETRMLNYKFFYHFYHGWQQDRYSFRRFDADLDHKFRLNSKNLLRLRGRLSLSNTGASKRVPFYLMETLGGSNIRNEDTLRGFRDYRFRDRNFALLQAEYVRELYGPLKFIGFYDTGKVASRSDGFDVGRLRHTFGLGLVILPRINENVLFRFYIAFGSGEGSHVFVGPGEGLTTVGDRLVR